MLGDTLPTLERGLSYGEEAFGLSPNSVFSRASQTNSFINMMMAASPNKVSPSFVARGRLLLPEVCMLWSPCVQKNDDASARSRQSSLDAQEQQAINTAFEVRRGDDDE